MNTFALWSILLVVAAPVTMLLADALETKRIDPMYKGVARAIVLIGAITSVVAFLGMMVNMPTMSVL